MINGSISFSHGQITNEEINTSLIDYTKILEKGVKFANKKKMFFSLHTVIKNIIFYFVYCTIFHRKITRERGHGLLAPSISQFKRLSIGNQN